jgi:DNA-binding NtrC family response regulator
MDTNPKGSESFAKIVVIDDDRDNLAYLVALLSRKEIPCSAFSHSEDALEYICANPVSVVVTDVFMPEVDGVQLITAIKGCRPEVAVIAMSGYQESYLRCMEALGATAGLSKPVDPKILMATLARCLDPDFTGKLC